MTQKNKSAAERNADHAHMQAALGLARRGLGQVWPNPAVGCVIVAPGGPGGENRVVGRGWTQPGGRPHAETEALARAGAAAQGATAYVTLEPCDHHGRTPPCTEALAAAGIVRVVAALEDPDGRVAGSGFQHLAEAGIQVETGTGAAEAREINAGYFMRVQHGRPLFTLKTATTLDGRIATAGGESQWITGQAARDRAHLLRAGHDAVMIGLATAVADNPRLTCRLPGMQGRSGVRIVLDGDLDLPVDGHLVAAARAVPTWVITVAADHSPRQQTLTDAGVHVIHAPPGDDGRPDLNWTAAMLGGRGLTRVLVEAGGRLAATMMRAGMIDRLVWFRAPSVIGGDGMPAIADLGLAKLDQMPGFERLSQINVGSELMETYRLKNGLL